MNPNAILQDLAVNLRRPGFIKSLAGQLAIAVGARMVADVADQAEERQAAAAAQLDEILETLRAAQAELEHTRNKTARELQDLADAYVVNGFADAAVRKRADELGYITGECRGCGARWPQSTGDDGPSPNGAPDGQPDVPPKLAGGYLATVAAMIPTSQAHPDDDDDDVEPTA